MSDIAPLLVLNFFAYKFYFIISVLSIAQGSKLFFVKARAVFSRIKEFIFNPH